MKQLLEELFDKYEDWRDTAEKDDWTTLNLCAEVLEDLREIAKWQAKG